MRPDSQEILLPWDDIDTILLDMDGTILDLNYDNHVWNQALPSAYAEKHSINEETARSKLIDHMQEIHGTIDFYSFPYWAQYTGLDITALHRGFTELIQFRPGAMAFLKWAKTKKKETIIATNAHPESIQIKNEVSALSSHVNHITSSHQYGYPKETPEFWENLQAEHQFNKAKTLFIDDNAPVIDSSRNYGVAHNLIVARPDSQKPVKTNLSYPSFDHYEEVCPQIKANN